MQQNRHMQVYGRFAGIYDRLMDDVNREEWASYLLSFIKKENALFEITREKTR